MRNRKQVQGGKCPISAFNKKQVFLGSKLLAWVKTLWQLRVWFCDFSWKIQMKDYLLGNWANSEELCMFRASVTRCMRFTEGETSLFFILYCKFCNFPTQKALRFNLGQPRFSANVQFFLQMLFSKLMSLSNAIVSNGILSGWICKYQVTPESNHCYLQDVSSSWSFWMLLAALK